MKLFEVSTSEMIENKEKGLRFQKVIVHWRAQRSAPPVGLNQAVADLSSFPEALSKLRRRLCEALTEEEAAYVSELFRASAIPYRVQEIQLPVSPDYFRNEDDFEEYGKLPCLGDDRTIRMGSLKIIGEFDPDQEGATWEMMMGENERAPAVELIKWVLLQLQMEADDDVVTWLLAKALVRDGLKVKVRDRHEGLLF